MLSGIVKNKIRLAAEAERQPNRSKKGDFLLRFGAGGYRYLVKDGEATPAGLYWAEVTGQPLPNEGWARDQVPTRRGRTD